MRAAIAQVTPELGAESNARARAPAALGERKPRFGTGKVDQPAEHSRQSVIACGLILLCAPSAYLQQAGQPQRTGDFDS